MEGVSSIPQLPLKVTFFAHLTLTVWAIQGSWLPISYVYYNTFFLLLLLWGTHKKESDEPISMALLLNVLSIILDIITIAVYSPHHPSFHGTFTIVMSIVNLMARPVTSVVLFRLANERGGNYNDIGVPNLAQYFGSGPSGAASRGPYEDIDRPVVAQSVPQNNIDPYSPIHKSMMGAGVGTIPD